MCRSRKCKPVRTRSCSLVKILWGSSLRCQPLTRTSLVLAGVVGGFLYLILTRLGVDHVGQHVEASMASMAFQVPTNSLTLVQ